MGKEESHVLWTGGWDSTFRIVELLTQTDSVIQPHYLRDPERASAELEMQTMEKLRGLLAERVTELENRLLPLLVTDVEEIPPEPGVTEALTQLRRQAHLGLQYDFLARYACLVARRPLELCIGYDRDGNVRRFVAERLIRDTDTRVPRYRLEERDDAVSGIFRWFYFPVVDCDKQGMRERARCWGMESILANTWFCHQPLLGRYACGTCRPCVYIMDDQQSWRVGLPGRLGFMLVERPKRLVPASFKAWLRQRAGRHLRRFLRA